LKNPRITLTTSCLY